MALGPVVIQPELVVKFDSGILFDTDDAQLKPASQTDLSEFARVLNEYPDTQLEIDGHTDDTGSKAHNLKLSADRAGAVTDFLVSSKVARSRLTSMGLGEEHPENTNATAAGRAKNRTVEIHIKANEDLKAADAENAKKKS